MGDLFGPDALEGEPTPRAADDSFSLRPFAAEIPQSAGVDPHTDPSEVPGERLFRLAQASAARGRRPEAEALFAQLLELEPDHIGGRVGLARLHERHGDTDEAFRHLTEAIRRHPEKAEPLVARGAFLARLKRHPEAEADLHRAIRLAPELPDPHFELGFALWRKGLAVDAAAALRRAAELAPTRADAEYYLGEALHQAGDDEGSLRALTRAAELEPGNPKPLQLMGRVLDRLGRPEEAQEFYRRAREAAPR